MENVIVSPLVADSTSDPQFMRCAAAPVSAIIPTEDTRAGTSDVAGLSSLAKLEAL